MVTREQSRSEASRFDRAAIAALAVVLLLTFAAQKAAAQTYTILYTFREERMAAFRRVDFTAMLPEISTA